MKIAKDNMIHIDAEYALQGKGRSITLYKKRVVKDTGELQLDFAGDFPSLTAALEHCIEMNAGNQRSLKAVIYYLQDAKEHITQALFEAQQRDKALSAIQLWSPKLKCLKCKDFRK